MTINQIRDHLATVVLAVLVAENKVKPTLSERIGKQKLTPDSRKKIIDDYIKDIVDEWLCDVDANNLEKFYNDEDIGNETRILSSSRKGMPHTR